MNVLLWGLVVLWLVCFLLEEAEAGVFGEEVRRWVLCGRPY